MDSQELPGSICEVCNYDDDAPILTSKKITTHRQHVLCRVCANTYAGNLSHTPNAYENPQGLINTSMATHFILDEQAKQIAELTTKIDQLQETISHMWDNIVSLIKDTRGY